MQIKNKWITGFADGDGCLTISKDTDKRAENLISFRHVFIISQNERSVEVLHAIKKHLKCGSVHKSGGKMMEYKVTAQNDIKNKIIPFFKQNPFKTTKKTKEFKLFQESFNFYISREKGTREMPQITQNAYTEFLLQRKITKSVVKLQENLSFIESLSDNQTQFFESKIHSESNQIVHNNITISLNSEAMEQTKQVLSQPNPHLVKIDKEWLSGIIDADGCFSCSFVNEYPRPQLVIVAILEELPLLVEIKNFIKCGNVRVRKANQNFYALFQISSPEQFKEKLFPLLFTTGNDVLLRTNKRITLQKFRKVISLILNEKHLTQEGKGQIQKLISDLNPKAKTTKNK